MDAQSEAVAMLRLLSDYSGDHPDPVLLTDLVTQAEAFLSAIRSLISD